MRVKRLNVLQLKRQIREKSKDIPFIVILSSIAIIISYVVFMFISRVFGLIFFFWTIILWVLTTGYVLDQKLDQLKVEVIENGNGRNKAR